MLRNRSSLTEVKITILGKGVSENLCAQKSDTLTVGGFRHLLLLVQDSRIVQFFALKSGKWSMADVLVVALFMTCIGFDGVISTSPADWWDTFKLSRLISMTDCGRI
jgi:hypothetical protein